MSTLLEKIKALVLARHYVIGQHAAERLEDRRILEWQIVHGIESAKLLSERAHDRPNPSIEVSQLLADGTEVKVIWSHIVLVDLAKLVTVHFFDE